MVSTLLAGDGNIEDEMDAPRSIPLHGVERRALDGVSVLLRSLLEPREKRRAESISLHLQSRACVPDWGEAVKVDGRHIARGFERSVEVLLRIEMAHDDSVRDPLGHDRAAVAKAGIDGDSIQPAVLPQVVERNRVHLACDDPCGSRVNSDREAEVPDPGEEVDNGL